MGPGLGVGVDLDRKDEKLVRDWAEMECRRGMVFGERLLVLVFVGLRGLCGWRDDGDGMDVDLDVDVDADVQDEDELIDGGALRRDQRDEMRCFFVSGVVGFLQPDEAVEAVDDEDDEKAMENRDGDPGRPMRMTVPFEAAESGRVWSGDERGLSLNGARARRAGFCLRFVRPPDACIVCTGWGFGGAIGAGTRVHRSGAE